MSKIKMISEDFSCHRICRQIILTLCLVIASLGIHASAQPNDKAVVVLDIDGAIGPATRDYITRGLNKAISLQANLVILRIDTPGGLDSAMRSIIKQILASPIPVVSYVSPSGSRAASAGTYILYASQIAAMAPATSIGAATPVQINGGLPEMPNAEEKQKNAEGAEQDAGLDSGEESTPKTAMERKIVNDAASYIRGLAKRNGRNAEWAELAVRKAASLSASEALEMSVIDVIASDMDDLLKQLNGRIVKVQGKDLMLHTEANEFIQISPDWRNKLLSVITDPNVAYILMLVGIYGLFFELLSPGAVVPGVLGGISLLLALYAFQVLPINYAGLGLIILGIAFMLAEVFVPSFGILGFGGVAAFVAGSVILMDEDNMSVSLPIVGGIALISSSFFLWVIVKLIKIRKHKVTTGQEQMLEMTGTAIEDFDTLGRVRVHGEVWNAKSDTPVSKGQAVQVISMEGLTLTIKTMAAIKPIAESH